MNPNNVWVGQQLQVNGSASAVAASTSQANQVGGDTVIILYNPASRCLESCTYHGISMQAVMDANGLWDPNNVRRATIGDCRRATAYSERLCTAGR
ncbi:MAG: hypothetical protein R2932_16760 [Caldilineaceae bacterium]